MIGSALYEMNDDIYSDKEGETYRFRLTLDIFFIVYLLITVMFFPL